MRAYVIKQFGGPEVFEAAEMPMPILKPGHVLIEVVGSSVNQLDIKMRSGAVPEVTSEFPAILNGDVSGKVIACADDVHGIKIGEEVYGIAGGIANIPGALADYMLVDARLIAKRPEKLSLINSAAVPLVAITAWEALFTKTNITAGQHILVHGGLGGVGHVGIQLAKLSGAIVSTTVSDDKDFETARKFGADYVINFREESVDDYVARITNRKGFDVVFDTVGGNNLVNSFAAVRLNGAVVTTAARIQLDLSPLHNKGLSFHVVFMMLPLIYNIGRERYSEILKKIAELIDRGELQLLIDSLRFKFSEISKAHAYLESGQAKGKVVLMRN